MKNYQKALIIDDDSDLCLLLKAILDSNIPDVRCAYSLESAKAMLKGIKPEVVFLDNNLPDGQGVNFIKEIKSILPEGLVIVISAVENSRERALENGANIFLEKPLTPAKINEALRLNNIAR